MYFLPFTQQLLFYVRRRPNANSVLWQLTHSAYCFSFLSLSQHQLSCPQGSPSHESVTKRVCTEELLISNERSYDTKRWLFFLSPYLHQTTPPFLFQFSMAGKEPFVSSPPSPPIGDNTAMSPVASYCQSIATQQSSQLGNWVATVYEAPPQRFDVVSCVIDGDSWHPWSHEVG